MTRRPSLPTIGLGVLVTGVLAIALVYAALTSAWASNRVRVSMIEFLEARFDADVAIEQISIALVPRVSIEGRGLTLTHLENAHGGPFIRLDRFSVAGWPLELLRRRVSVVTVDGFALRVERGSTRGGRSRGMDTHDVTIDEVVVRNGLLVIVPNDPRKLPLRFELQEIAMSHFAFDRSSPYRAHLTNPKPRGSIDSTGQIGPWSTLDLRSTPLSGGYTFADADLATIRGIGGTLTSTGRFEGVLERIRVRGVTSTPDFQLQLTGQPLNLDTRFEAMVDGTSGDTYLEEVDAMLGQSHILAKGSVVGEPGAKGRTVSLDVKVDNGRLDDFMRLAVKAVQPPMRGVIGFDTAFELPAGQGDVPQRLRLTGTFNIQRGQFTSDAVQDKVDQLSRRGRGEPKNEALQDVMSTFGGAFTLRDGLLRLPRLQFRVSGAAVDLSGAYRLRGGDLGFAGTLKLDAPLSRTTTGFKSILLKAVDPFFRKAAAGTVLPIKVGGTVEKPAFGLDIGKALTRK
ncbi:MAG: hypothetical protein ABL993_07575 [Vicinamibacterales bacterium]